jgi:hypothetical protein
MRDDILSYHEVVGREGRNLQAGMNFHVRPGYSILLMSTRKGAPYHDRWDGTRGLLIYEGHDATRSAGEADPKTVDQPMRTPRGTLTANGKFYEAAKLAADGRHSPERVRVYEKLERGIWSDKGMFALVDASIVSRDGRKVFNFMLEPSSAEQEAGDVEAVTLSHTRLIPTHVKVEVWKRDNGSCVLCGSNENLHYDHDLPFSKGGSSLTAANVRILCARHNLQKSDRIE